MEVKKGRVIMGIVCAVIAMVTISMLFSVAVARLSSGDDVERDLPVNTELSGSLSGAGKKDYYKVVVESGTKLTVKIDGPNSASVDFDLYIKKDAKPTTSSYLARGYTSSSDEQVSISNPSGTYYVMVYAYKGSGSYTITATVEGGNGGGSGGSGGGNGGGSNEPVELTSGVAKAGSLDSTNTKAYYKITVSSGTVLKVVLDGPNGADFDLYVKKGAMPTTSSYDVRGYTNSADEQVSISNPSGTYYIMVNRYSGSGSYTITATVEGSNNNGVTPLTPGNPVTGRMSGSGDKAYYSVTLASPDTLLVDMKGNQGDFDLYIRKGELPTQTLYDDWSHKSGSNERVTITNAQPGIYYIMVRSYSGSGTFTLTAILNSQMPDSDGDGFWDVVEIEYGLDPNSPQYNAVADKIPWSGYWWPYNEGGTSIPCSKYDTYMKNAHNINPGAEAWEISRHGNPNADYWVGHCHAWSAAAVLEDEPTHPVSKNGVTFTVGDLKGLLTESHFADPVEFSIGTGNPKTFHLTLLKWVGTMRKPIIADVYCGAEVWNHPLYKYSMQVTVDPNDPSVRHYACTITYVSDGVSPDFVGHQDFTRTYYYYLKFLNGDISECGWEGSSAEPGNHNAHPDFFWRPLSARAASDCPVDYNIVKNEILGGN